MQTETVQTARPFHLMPHSQSEWVRIFAYRLAQRKPSLSPLAAITTAIEEFSDMGDLQPEEAVEMYRESRA